MFVYIQQSTWYEQVFSDCGRYWKLHNEYHQHVSRKTSRTPSFQFNQSTPLPSLLMYLKNSKKYQNIPETKSVSIDHTRHWSPRYKTQRINPTPKVLRTCSVHSMIGRWSVLVRVQHVEYNMSHHVASTTYVFSICRSFTPIHTPTLCPNIDCAMVLTTSASWKSVQSKKGLVLIILVIVFKHTIKI